MSVHLLRLDPGNRTVQRQLPSGCFKFEVDLVSFLRFTVPNNNNNKIVQDLCQQNEEENMICIQDQRG